MNISYKILSVQQIDDVVKLLSKTFTDSEPITKVLGISKEDFSKYIRIYVEDSVKYNLSSVAINDDTGKVVGCTINRDYFAPDPQNIYEVPDTFKPMQAIMTKLNSEFKNNFSIEKGKYFYLFIGGVDPDFSGLGINSQKAFFNEEIAKKNNFKYLIVEPTGPATQHIYLNKLGFEKVLSISYKKFIYETKFVFSEINEVENCIIAKKKISNG